MCSGMVHPNLVVEALTKGADGVLIIGCHPGDCHYLDGNLRAQGRREAIELMLEDLGRGAGALPPGVGLGLGGPALRAVVKEMVTSIKELGPSPYSTRV